MTQQQLATMMSHPDPRVRTYALRHAPELLARGEEPEPRDPWAARDSGVEVIHRGQQEFPEMDLMAASEWHIWEFADGAAVAVDRLAGRRAHALEVNRDAWYIYQRDLALLADWPDLPF